MTQKQNTNVAQVGEHGLKKHDIKVSTVVFMIFCLVAAGCYGIEEMIPECGPGLTIVMLCVLPFVWALPFGCIASELTAGRRLLQVGTGSSRRILGIPGRMVENHLDLHR